MSGSAELLYSLVAALPSRHAEEQLVQFRARPDAWETCLTIAAGAEGQVGTPFTLLLFTAQTLHALARRCPPVSATDPVAAAAHDQFLAARQNGLLAALARMGAAAAPQGRPPGHIAKLLTAALAALSVRSYAQLPAALPAVVQRLPPGFAVQLLLAVAEEGEALQARAGERRAGSAGSAGAVGPGAGCVPQ